MLYTITANILVNVDDDQYPEHQDAVVTDGLNEMFREVQFQNDRAGEPQFIVDWGYEAKPGTNEHERNVVARPDLTLATYEEGDAWVDYIWPAPSSEGWIDAWNGWYPTQEQAREEGAAGVGSPWILRYGEDLIKQDEADQRRAYTEEA